jgi:hypothetical protein
MSFRLFVYYCALCGAGAALLGWALGRLAAPENSLAEASVQGLWLGLTVASGLALVDALWNISWRQPHRVAVRVVVAMAIGSVGGLVGGLLGQFFLELTKLTLFQIVGWTLTGLLVGLAIGVFDLISRMLHHEDAGGAKRKLLYGCLGGAVGGAVGGVLLVVVHAACGVFFRGKPAELLWTPSALGFVALGACIGLMIGLAQIIFKQAWIKVEAGFRAGRELILSRVETTIGRAEACDIGLFGDAEVERLHARIHLWENGYHLTDANTPGGTYLNGERIATPTALRAGDVIQVGQSVLRFHLGRKHSPAR